VRIETGDSVILRREAIEMLLEQGHNLSGQVAEVVDRHTTLDGIDLTLRFDTVKTLITDIPAEFVQHIGIA
jgi:hypothetical protein